MSESITNNGDGTRTHSVTVCDDPTRILWAYHDGRRVLTECDAELIASIARLLYEEIEGEPHEAGTPLQMKVYCAIAQAALLSVAEYQASGVYRR